MADSAPRPLYAGPIQDATRSGNVEQMRAIEQEASQHLEEVEKALDELRAAIGRQSS